MVSHSTNERSREGDAARLPGWARVALVLLVGWHLFAVVMPPASVPPASPMLGRGYVLTSPYTRAMFLNHGYRFFGPNPPEVAMLLDFEIESDDGTETTYRIPNRDIFPRLLYHRHFMLCEQLWSVPEDMRDQWVEAMARNAWRARGPKSGTGRVRVTRVSHFVPSPDLVREGAKLDAPASYDYELLGVFEMGDPSGDSPDSNISARNDRGRSVEGV